MDEQSPLIFGYPMFKSGNNSRREVAAIKGRPQRRKKNPAPAKQAVKKNKPRNRDTQLSAPVAQSSITRYREPAFSMSPSSDGRIRIRHRELLADVLGTTDFAVRVARNINPGLASAFNWLSNLGRNYESYQFKSLSFEYVTSSVTTKPGSVFLACDFDAGDAAPTSKQQIMSYHDAVRCSPWMSATLHTSKQDLSKFGVQRFIRVGNFTTGAQVDIKTYDICKFYVAAVGNESFAQIGEIYVSYDVELMTPQSVSASQSVSLLCDTNVVTRASYIGAPRLITGVLPVEGGGNTLTFDRVGEYIVDILVTGTVFVPGNHPVEGGTHAQHSTLVFGTTANGATNSTFVILVRITEFHQTLTLDWDLTCATLTSSVIRISEYDFANG